MAAGLRALFLDRSLGSPYGAGNISRIVANRKHRSTAVGEKLAQATENGEGGEPAWKDARPFGDIPGPRGWPFIGVLRDYTKGKMFLSSRKTSFGWYQEGHGMLLIGVG